jgi:hypothetical protein
MPFGKGSSWDGTDAPRFAPILLWIHRGRETVFEIGASLVVENREAPRAESLYAANLQCGKVRLKGLPMRLG